MKNMRTIEVLRVEIKPDLFGREVHRSLRVASIVNGLRFEFSQPFPVDDFSSSFDQLMSEASREIRRLVENHFRGDGQSVTVNKD